MEDFTLNMLNDKSTFSETKGSIIFFINNINSENKEEIMSMFENKKTSLKHIQKTIESIGGTLEIIPLDDILKKFKDIKAL